MQVLLFVPRIPAWVMLIERFSLKGSHAQRQRIGSCPAAWLPRFSLGILEKARVPWSQLASNWMNSIFANNFLLQQLFKSLGCVPQQVSANWSRCWLLWTLKWRGRHCVDRCPLPDLTSETSLVTHSSYRLFLDKMAYKIFLINCVIWCCKIPGEKVHIKACPKPKEYKELLLAEKLQLHWQWIQ